MQENILARKGEKKRQFIHVCGVKMTRWLKCVLKMKEIKRKSKLTGTDLERF